MLDWFAKNRVLDQEMESYFLTLRSDDSQTPYLQRIDAIWAEMDLFAEAHPKDNANTLKAQLHELIAFPVESVRVLCFCENGTRHPRHSGRTTGGRPVLTERGTGTNESTAFPDGHR